MTNKSRLSIEYPWQLGKANFIKFEKNVSFEHEIMKPLSEVNVSILRAS